MVERKGRRKLIEAMLASGGLEEVVLQCLSDRTVVSDVFRLLFHKDETLEHRAAWVLGQVASKDEGLARRLLERLTWAMNDESGQYCPGAPYAIAYIAASAPKEPVKGFVSVLVHALEDDGHAHEVLSALGLIVETYRDEVLEVMPKVLSFLRHKDPKTRAMAARVAQRASVEIDDETYSALVADTSPVTYVEALHPVTTTVRDIVLHGNLRPCDNGTTCKKKG